MLFYLLKLAFALKMTKIPSTGSPPSRLSGAAAIHDNFANQIITFGGFDYELNHFSSELKTFSLTSLEWGILTSHSNIIPPGLEFSRLYIRVDRKLFVFFGTSSLGTSNEIYSYDLIRYVWKVEEPIGYRMLGRAYFGFTEFNYNNTNYVGIFGGLTVNGIDFNLYLVNMEMLEIIKMPYNDQGPSIRTGASLVFYNNTIYMYGYIQQELAPNDDMSGIYAYSLIEEKWSLISFSDKLKPEMRYQHYAYIYNDEMYVMFGFRIDVNLDLKDVWKFSFNNQNWTLLVENIGVYRIESADVIIGDKVYLLYGREAEKVFNSILTIDFSEDVLGFEYVSNNMNVPMKRIHHCSFVIGDFMYIFGGLYSYGEYLNDMWRFHFVSEYWESVKTLGEIPSARAQFACTQTTGNSIAIFGGTDGTNIFDDMYFYYESYNTWVKAKVSSNKPSSRWSSCMCYNNYKYFIIGGQDFKQAFNDIWLYDYVEEKYSLIRSEFYRYGLMRQNCWLTTDEGKISIFIVGGAKYDFSPNILVFKIIITSELYAEVYNPIDSINLMLSETDVVVSNNKMFMVFGSSWNKIALSNITVFDLKTYNVVSKKNYLQKCFIYGHSISHYGDAFYIFGGGTSINTTIIPNSMTNQLYKLTLDDDGQEFNIPCSDGTFTPYCQPCIEGTYFLKDHCEPCPKGTYSSYISAVDIEQCFLCPSGKFTSDEGVPYCIDCPAGTLCPIGATEPRFSSEYIISSSVQPLAFSGKSSYISKSALKLWYGFIGVSVIILFIAIISKRIWKVLTKADIFANQHAQNLNAPIIYKKTHIGGLFSLLFILVAIVSIVGSTMSYSLNNITEIKALVPVITLEEDIIAQSIIITCTFYIYGGKCVSDKNICSEDISYSIKDLIYTSLTNICEVINDSCVVQLNFNNARIEKASASVLFDLKEPRSYASIIGVNITSSSSIPNEKSSITTSTQPPSKENIFRGTSPTIINFKFIPSVFTSESAEWADLETGFHVSITEDPVIGSLATQKTIYSQAYLRILINIEKSDTGMTTQRKLNNTLFVFIGGLLGSVFGIMGFFTVTMVFTEGIVGFIEKKRKRKVFLKDLYENMERFNYEFNRHKIKTPNKKSRPTCYQIATSFN